jgi:N-hydroxyarylamine O-acetyltransferase
MSLVGEGNHDLHPRKLKQYALGSRTAAPLLGANMWDTSMTDEFELDHYLARIGFAGPIKPDLTTLCGIHAAHVNAIPFEGLDPLLRRPVKLDMASLQHKLLGSRRGGYCFEQNEVLKGALEATGFKVTGLGARVRWMSQPDSPLGPKIHTLLKVDLPEGTYLADAGFGACMLDAPLRLETDIAQRTAMATYRLSEAGGLFWLSTKRPAGWRTMFAFDLEPPLPSDYELGNWYASTSPFVPFTSTLMMQRVSSDRRYKLVNSQLTVEDRDGEIVSERVLGDAEEMRKVLDETFNITPPAPIEEVFAIINA